MAEQADCPRCGTRLELSAEATRVPRCTSCGGPILCPLCHGWLHYRDGSFCCANCSRQLGDEELDLQETVSFDTRSSSTVKGNQRHRLHVPGFELLEELGRGGMGIVYRARQTSLNRDVALKVLKPERATEPDELTRFRNEAEVAGRLTDANILPVFDVLDAEGAPVIVMPYVKGTDMKRIVRDRFAVKQGRDVEDPHPWAQLDDREYLGKVLPLLDKLVQAVATMHGQNVLHRDIKPSNVLLDERGNVWLSDFGLSRLGEVRLKTAQGAPIGTFGYMSPEQATGELNVDARSDLFGLGVTLYQTLTLELPYGAGGARLSDRLPAPPSKRQRLLSRDLDAVILKSIEPHRLDRYDSVAHLQEDWQLARQGLLPGARRLGPIGRLSRRLSRHRSRVATVTMLLLLVVLIGILVARPSPLPTPSQNRKVRVVTEPAGARVVLVPIDEEPYDATDGQPLPDQAIRPQTGQLTPMTLSDIPPGRYLVVAGLSDQRFHEVYRTVPLRGETPSLPFPHRNWEVSRDDIVELPPIVIPEDRAARPVDRGMYRFKGGQFTMGFARPIPHHAVPHTRDVAAFFIDRKEVTIAEYRDVMERLPPPYRRFNNTPADAYPVSFVTFDEAIAYAEKVGKRLPSEVEYEFAATLGGTQDFPWAAREQVIEDWQVGLAGQPKWDQTPTDPPIHGLFSNVAEWTSSMLGPYPSVKLPEAPIAAPVIAESRRSRVVRGGPWSVVVGYHAPEEWKLGPRWRYAVTRTDRYPGLGFRCARSDRPRFLD